MATDTSFRLTQVEQKLNEALEGFLQTHENLALFNDGLDAYKKKPSQEPLITIRNQFNEIKSAWTELKSDKTYQDFEISWQTIEISMERTEKRVNKLVQKYAQSSAMLQSPSSLSQTPMQISSSQTCSPAAQVMAKLAEKMGFIPFVNTHSEALTACFGNFYECKIEFGGKQYLNAESAFQAQKYTDQPHVMARFEKTNGDAAVKIARDVPMLPNRVDDWDNLESPHVNKVDIMMQVLRAKFRQNPHLIELLLATGNAYLVLDSPRSKNQDRFWCDGFNGDGQNQLGICLMRLREEYGGVGVVPKAKEYIQAVCEILLKNDPNLLEVDRKPPVSSDQCKQCKTKPKYYDSLMQCFHEYCSTNCVRMSRFKCDIPLILRCTYCKREPQFRDASGRIYDFCGKICAKKAGYIMQ